ncbi:Phosphoglucomutase, cytoplasmic 2 [Zea mays]|uniref:phosphoglucomutase (alpha-D-glucose-1,6-bisphosphate-dependent) n=1 Tax=Zea mays TaxID=4577 RepID=A0A3L6E132_MAIZE|nr:Phosphoglucomutase, cytoplasmic 2 [Zea mays]
MAAANGVRCVWVGQNSLMSTPAVSAVIRERIGVDGSKATGAFILTASHNPGGPKEEDFGGGHPDPNLTYAKELVERMGLGKSSSNVEPPEFGAAADGDADHNMILGKRFFVTPSDSVAIIAANAVQSIPYFASGLKGVARHQAGSKATGAFILTASHNPGGPKEEDFGGGHPDPNLTYAKELVERMGLGKSSSNVEPPEFGAAADGDADRNMILGKRFFVTPSDSVAIIAANAVQSIPYFASGLKGVARSMPTSAALDVVANNLNLKFFEVPTGWKFFGNLMDAGMCSICGEESFGTGSDHIREKDGIWAVLAWLSIIAFKNKDNLGGDKLVTVEDIVRQHWATYGRHYYSRYDYENVDAGAAKELMANLVSMQSSLSDVNKLIKEIWSDVSEVVAADEFEYKDPVFRLSGTGSVGATIRVYIEQYEKDSSKTGRDSQEALAPLVVGIRETVLTSSSEQSISALPCDIPSTIAFPREFEGKGSTVGLEELGLRVALVDSMLHKFVNFRTEGEVAEAVDDAVDGLGREWDGGQSCHRMGGVEVVGRPPL